MSIKEIKLSDWEQFGGGGQGDSFYSRTDDSIMLKLFSKRAPQETVTDEIVWTENIYNAGIPCVEPGIAVYAPEVERYGIIFRRIHNKKSLCRAIADDPSCTAVMAAKLSAMAKILHGSTADKSRFKNIKDLFASYLAENESLSPDMRRRCEDALAAIPEGNRLVHGDFHFGNVITDGQRDYLIDLSTFGYGDPDWDISMQFLVSHSNGDKMIEYLFHVTDEQAFAFWKEFKADYYGPNAPSDEELFIRFKPYMLLRTLFFEHDRGPDPHVAAMREAFV